MTVTVEPTGEQIVLTDDGIAPDETPGDGTYTAGWTPQNVGTYVLHFPNDDAVSVHVPAPSGYQVEETPFSWRTIAGTSLELGDIGAATVSPPFPVHLGGREYQALFVTAKGLVSTSGPFLGYENMPLPVDGVDTLIAPYWDDLLTVSDILVKSSNVGMTQIGWKMGIPTLYEGVTKFGFGKRTGVANILGVNFSGAEYACE